MTQEELLNLISQLKIDKCESSTLELKTAERGCPRRLYDTLSSFSNQDGGGIILFGIDEKEDFNEVGVYDPQDLQQKVTNQCNEMIPKVRPLFTILENSGKHFVSAEIPGIDISQRPCYYRGKGKVKGSYVRVGDSDEPMSDYEIYSFEAFKKRYQDDIRVIENADFSSLDQQSIKNFIDKAKAGKPNFSRLDDEQIMSLLNIKKGNSPTMAAFLQFSPFPQGLFPQLAITAVVIPGVEKAETGIYGERFTDNKRIEGNINDMLEGALEFVKRNMKTATRIDCQTGKREDRSEYPVDAIREAVLNALVHRDYSIYTEGTPIQIEKYNDRIEITSPGGLYGRLSVNELGMVQADTRNPVLVTNLELMAITENRYSGIPVMKRSMKEYNLEPPVFKDLRNCFKVIFYNSRIEDDESTASYDSNLLDFLNEPRSRKEIADFLELKSVSYAIAAYINPLIEEGLVEMTIPEKPGSHKQRFVKSANLK